MLIGILELALIVGGGFFVLRWAYQSWHRAGVETKVEEVKEVEREYGIVNNTTKKYKNTGAKKNAISKFKSN